MVMDPGWGTAKEGGRADHGVGGPGTRIAHRGGNLHGGARRFGTFVL